MDSSSMAICFLIPLLIHILVENAGAERILPFKQDNNSMHLQNNSAIVEIENELYTNLTWLNLEQREVLQDIIKDGWNASDLQQEILLFYNEETSVRRKYAAYHLLSSCFNLLNNFCSLERFEKLIKDITANTSNTQTFSFEVTKRLNQETNETELVQLFMNGCFPILSSETDDFLSQVSEMEDTEKADEIYNEFMINYANDTTQKKFRKANVLFQLLKIEEAFAIYDEIITLEPNNTEYIKKYAEALIFLERFDKAIQLYDRVLKMETENLEIVDKKLIALIKHADQKIF
uniref:Polyprotein allergen nematode domain-containing protein n=1 Tax=Panagrolaimus superbus TaxID=310955 RepID=A0A914YJK2_9BILA